MKKFDRALYIFQCVLSSAAFIGMIGLTVANVFVRLVISKTLAWSEELTYACFNWAVYIGIGIVYRNQGMVSVGAIVDKLPAKAKRCVMIFVHALVLVTNICLTVWGVQLAVFAMARKTPILKLPYFWIDLAIPVGTVILAYYSLKYLIMTIRGQEVQEASLEERS